MKASIQWGRLSSSVMTMVCIAPAHATFRTYGYARSKPLLFMWTRICLMLLAVMIPLNCPSRPERYLGGQESESAASIAAKEAQRKAISAAFAVRDAKTALIQQRLAALSQEPWRIVDGVTNSIYGKGWYHFSGRVEKVCPEGLLVRGSISSLESENDLGNLDLANNPVARAPGLVLPNQSLKYQQFAITNFPVVVAAGDDISFLSYRMAKDVGTIVLSIRTASPLVRTPPPLVKTASPIVRIASPIVSTALLLIRTG